MKRIIHAALAAGVLAAGSLTSRAWAQPQGSNSGPGGGTQQGGPGGGPEMMKKHLGLTDDQVAKLKAAMEARKSKDQPLREQMQGGMKKLGEQLRAKAADADISATLEQLKTARKSMREQEDAFVTSLESFLTPTQRAKMLMGMIRRERGGGQGRGRWGGQGGKSDKPGAGPANGGGGQQGGGDKDAGSDD